VSLEGSLETVALPEVLQLLSDTSKTGELLVRGDRGEGRLWFGQGRLTGFHVARTEQAADALFDLLRNGEGRFSFEADAERPEEAHPVADEDGEVRPVLEVAQARLAEWVEIVAVVPSLQHVVSLAEESPRARLHLDSSQWALIVAVGEGRPVQGILDRASLPEFDGCKSLKVLVDSGLATVSEPVVDAPAEPATEVVDEQPAVEVAELPAELVFEDVVDELEPEHQTEFTVAHEPEAVTETEPVDDFAAEAALDPHEFVFSAPAGTAGAGDEAEEPVEETAPWSVGLADAPTNGAEAGDYVPQPVPYPDGQAGSEANGHDARSALEALLAEIPAEEGEVETYHNGPDGLADRGPWTSNELADMSAWHDEEEPQQVTSWGSFQVTSSHAPHDAEAHSTASAGDHEDAVSQYTDPEAQDDSAEEEEPEQKPDQVNRGLLLKFLSSVRS
jgi:hypothetical protein